MKTRVVTFKDSVKAFDGIFARFGHFSTTFADGWPGVTNRKECTDEVTKDTEGKGGVGGDYYIFDASISQKETIDKQLPAGEFFYFNHYSRQDKPGGGTFGVESVLDCSKSLISGFEEVEVFDVNDQKFVVLVEELKNIWNVNSGLEGFHQPHVLSDLYRQGRFLEVTGAVDYFNLRDALRDYLDEVDEVKTVQDDYPDPRTKKEVKDFYTHIVMATIARLP